MIDVQKIFSKHSTLISDFLKISKFGIEENYINLKANIILNRHKIIPIGTSLVVQWLRLHASNAGGTGSIPGQ